MLFDTTEMTPEYKEKLIDWIKKDHKMYSKFTKDFQYLVLEDGECFGSWAKDPNIQYLTKIPTTNFKDLTLDDLDDRTIRFKSLSQTQKDFIVAHLNSLGLKQYSSYSITAECLRFDRIHYWGYNASPINPINPFDYEDFNELEAPQNPQNKVDLTVTGRIQIDLTGFEDRERLFQLLTSHKNLKTENFDTIKGYDFWFVNGATKTIITYDQKGLSNDITYTAQDVLDHLLSLQNGEAKPRTDLSEPAKLTHNDLIGKVFRIEDLPQEKIDQVEAKFAEIGIKKCSSATLKYNVIHIDRIDYFGQNTTLSNYIEISVDGFLENRIQPVSKPDKDNDIVVADSVDYCSLYQELLAKYTAQQIEHKEEKQSLQEKLDYLENRLNDEQTRSTSLELVLQATKKDLNDQIRTNADLRSNHKELEVAKEEQLLESNRTNRDLQHSVDSLALAVSEKNEQIRKMQGILDQLANVKTAEGKLVFEDMEVETRKTLLSRFV